MKRKTRLTILIVSIAFQLNAQYLKNEYKNNFSINLLAIPVGNSVVSFEHYFPRQSVWVGYEHHFNGVFKEEDKTLNSFALEYRRHIMKNQQIGNGLFVGLYSKYRSGQEFSIEVSGLSHRYQAVFSGLNAGYQYHINRLVLSLFAGYGLPLYLTEEGEAGSGDTELNKGYDHDLRLGLMAGFAF
jgi:outer membrane phospholipase A